MTEQNKSPPAAPIKTGDVGPSHHNDCILGKLAIPICDCDGIEPLPHTPEPQRQAPPAPSFDQLLRAYIDLACITDGWYFHLGGLAAIRDLTESEQKCLADIGFAIGRLNTQKTTKIRTDLTFDERKKICNFADYSLAQARGQQ
jgi:hypothetical protein